MERKWCVHCSFYTCSSCMLCLIAYGIGIPMMVFIVQPVYRYPAYGRYDAQLPLPIFVVATRAPAHTSPAFCCCTDREKNDCIEAHYLVNTKA